MIIEMSKVRVLGPRPDLPKVVQALQDFGLLHLAAAPRDERLTAVHLSREDQRERRNLRRILQDLDAISEAWPLPRVAAERASAGLRSADYALWARGARRARRALERLRAETAALHEERALIQKYRAFFRAFESLLESVARSPKLTAYGVVLPRAEEAALGRLEETLGLAVGDEFTIKTQPLETGELAVLLVLPAAAAGRVEKTLADARVPEIPVPASYGGPSLAEAVPRMLQRLEAIPGELAKRRAERRRLLREDGPELALARAAIHDRLSELEARTFASTTAHAFVLEGWLPAEARPQLAHSLAREFGDRVVTEEVAKEAWAAEEAPVVLRNPRLFRPFELLIRLLPLPRYGTIDPTPYVAVFFPMFFGLILGDIGYGAILATLGLILHARSKPDTLARTVSEILGPCAAFAIIFGVLYGELFGDLGRRVFGLRALFDREEGAIAFLVLAVGLGFVHVLLGLGLGFVSALKGHAHMRLALGRGVALIMVVLIVIALLAAFQVLPQAFFTPVVIALLAAFPILIVAEGFVAPVELLSTLGNILSYARIMALGTASVMLAVVANRMAGAVGSAAVGIVFALLFHLVNFAVGVFSPTIHALRLHYVEFFGKFYSPGGRRYEPLGHWRPTPERHP